jgi:hypothetical protein
MTYMDGLNDPTGSQRRGQGNQALVLLVPAVR